MVSVSASVNLPLHHKVQKFSSDTGSPGWSLKKGRKTVVWLCVLYWKTQPGLERLQNRRSVKVDAALAGIYVEAVLDCCRVRATVRCRTRSCPKTKSSRTITCRRRCLSWPWCWRSAVFSTTLRTVTSGNWCTRRAFTSPRSLPLHAVLLA